MCVSHFYQIQEPNRVRQLLTVGLSVLAPYSGCRRYMSLLMVIQTDMLSEKWERGSWILDIFCRWAGSLEKRKESRRVGRLRLEPPRQLMGRSSEAQMSRIT